MLYIYVVFNSITHVCYDVCFSEADATIKVYMLNTALKGNDIIYRRINVDYMLDDYFPNNEEVINRNFRKAKNYLG